MKNKIFFGVCFFLCFATFWGCSQSSTSYKGGETSGGAERAPFGKLGDGKTPLLLQPLGEVEITFENLPKSPSFILTKEVSAAEAWAFRNQWLPLGCEAGGFPEAMKQNAQVQVLDQMSLRAYVRKESVLRVLNAKEIGIESAVTPSWLEISPYRGNFYSSDIFNSRCAKGPNGLMTCDRLMPEFAAGLSTLLKNEPNVYQEVFPGQSCAANIGLPQEKYFFGQYAYNVGNQSIERKFFPAIWILSMQEISKNCFVDGSGKSIRYKAWNSRVVAGGLLPSMEVGDEASYCQKGATMEVYKIEQTDQREILNLEQHLLMTTSPTALIQ